MDSVKLNEWLKVFANIGIVLGLLMVGVQLKQNSDLARMQLVYEESTRAIELESEVIGERGAAVWAKSIEDPENLTLEEVRIMEALLWSFYEQLRGTYRLAQLGLLTEDDWLARVNSEVTFYFSDPYSRAWWKNFSRPGKYLPPDLSVAINNVIESDTSSSYDYITTAQRTMQPFTPEQ